MCSHSRNQNSWAARLTNPRLAGIISPLFDRLVVLTIAFFKSRSSSPVQDIALSRRQHGFKSRTGRHLVSVTYTLFRSQRDVCFAPGATAIRLSRLKNHDGIGLGTFTFVKRPPPLCSFVGSCSAFCVVDYPPLWRPGALALWNS